MSATAPSRCAVLAAWLTAVLRGRVSIDHALDTLKTDDETTLFDGLPDGSDSTSFTGAVGELRQSGVSGLAYIPAYAGESGALPGPPDFNALAIARGGAVVAVDGRLLGLTSELEQHGPDDDAHFVVQWHTAEVARFGVLPATSLSEAEQALLVTLAETADELRRLDVARWRDEATDLADGWRKQPASHHAPPGLPDRAYRLIERSEHMATVLDLAIEDDGAAVSSSEAERRRQLLRALQRTVRQASAVGWNSGLIPQPSVR